MCTMLRAKKSELPPQPVRDYRRELEYLYARKSAVEAAIASLEVYDRCRTAEPPTMNRKTA